MSTESKQVPVSQKTQEPQRVSRSRLPRTMDDLDRIFDRFTGRNWLRSLGWDAPLFRALGEPLEGWLPNIDIVDRENDILVRAEVPGVDKKDLDVLLTDNVLTIKGKTRHEEKEEKGDYYRCEISRGAFVRSITLPGSVDTSKVAAEVKDGMLEIVLPKTESSRRRTIEIK